MMSGLANMAPILLREHRPDVYGILSAMNETSANKIATQKLTDTIKQVREVFQDDELLSFFKSSVRREKTAPSVPSAASPSQNKSDFSGTARCDQQRHRELDIPGLCD